MFNLTNKLQVFLLNPYTWIVLSTVLLLGSKLIFKVDYMNCFEIVDKQINNFRCKNSNKILIVPFFIHFILPLLIAIGIVNIAVIDKDIINNITVILSILTSMFFTLLALIIDMKSKIEIRDKKQGARIIILKDLIIETYYSIMFEILTSIILLILSFVHMFTKKYSYISSMVIYYFLFLLIINLFMVMKRIFKIIKEDLG